MTFPPHRWQILKQHQIQLENWITKASIEKIKEYIASAHNLLYPDDWNSINCLCLHNNSSTDNYIQGCEHCQEIISALLTISEIERPELKSLFNKETK